jgi:hypothetical protein
MFREKANVQKDVEALDLTGQWGMWSKIAKNFTVSLPRIALVTAKKF